jgi:hypothetical protein
MKLLNEQQIQLHVPVVAWLLIVFNAIALLVALGIFLLMGSLGELAPEPEAQVILPIARTLIPAFLVLLTLPGFIAAFGLLARKPWGRILGIVVGILALPGFPFGTFLGGYAIFVLVQDVAPNYLETLPKQRGESALRLA